MGRPRAFDVSCDLPSSDHRPSDESAARPALPVSAITAGQSYRSFLNTFARLGAVAVAFIGAAVMVGWLLDIPVVESVLPGLATMKFNSALGLLASGVALFLLHISMPGSRALRLARLLAMFVAAVGGLTLLEHMFGIDLGIDAISSYPGRMAPATALSFLFVGLALLTLKASKPGLAARAHLLAIPPLFIATLAIVGHAYGVSALYQVAAYASMAAHTAVAFFVISLSLLAMDSEHGLTSIATSDTAGGIVCRRLLPTIPIALLLLGWLCLRGQHEGLYGTDFDTALMVLLSIAVSVLGIATTAAGLHQVDLTCKRAEQEIVQLNADLEARVAERTEQLAQSSAELAAANRALSCRSTMR